MFNQLINRFKNIDFNNLIYYEEKIGGLSVNEDKIVLIYLEGEEIIFQKEVSLPIGTIENGVLKNPDQLFSALKKIQEDKKLPSKSVIVSLPSIVAQPFIFEFFPNLKIEETNEAINLIVDSSLPLEKDKIFVDWEEIGVDKLRENKFLLAMGIKESISPYLEVVSKSGLAPIATETHAWSLARAINFKDEPVLAINFEQSQIIFTVYKDNILVFQFNLPAIGVESARNNISVKQRESVSEKNKKKKKKDEKITEAILPEQKSDELRFFKIIIFSLRRLLYFLASDSAYGFNVKNIILLGNQEVKQKFQNFFANELTNYPANELIISGSETEKSFIFSLGAAKRGLLKRRDDTICSLMPIGTESAYERQRLISFLDFFQKLAVAFGGFFIILFLGVFVLVSVIYQNASKNMTKYQAEIPSGITTINEAAAVFNQRINQLTQIEKKSPNWENLFLELDKITNSGLIIGNLNVGVGQPIGISGFAKNRENLLQLKSDLEQSPIFMPIILPLSLLIGKENIYFSFKLELKNPSIIYNK